MLKYSSTMLPDSAKAEINASLPVPFDALFDRVINLKIRRGDLKFKANDVNQSFIIRSDYEVVKSGKTSQIRRCSMKPQIRVSYKMVTGEVGIELDIYITNYHVFSLQGQNGLEDLSYSGNPISQVQVVLGYAPMFKMPKDADSFYGLQSDGTLELDCPKGATKLTMDNITYATYDKSPPDSVFHIHGYVGNIEHGRVSDILNGAVSNAVDSTEDFTFKNGETGNGKHGRFPSRLFYYLIQKRFVRNESEWLDSYDLKYVDKKTGFLNDAGAEKYGVKVIVPEGSSLLKADVDSDKSAKDKDGNEVFVDTGATIYLGSANSVSGTLIMLQKSFFSNMRFAPLNNGDWVAWDWRDLNDEKTASVVKANLENLHQSVVNDIVSSDKYLTKMSDDKLQLVQGLQIPAVYDISISAGVCTITCPFFYFLNPFQKLKFNSRYPLSDLTTYYARPTANVTQFFAIGQTVEFSTTGNENKMVISCVGTDKYVG